MDHVKPVTKWMDGAGVLYDSEAEAILGEARRIVRTIVCDAIIWSARSVDVDALADRRNALVDALLKIERAK